MREIKWGLVVGLFFLIGSLLGKSAEGTLITINPASDFHVIIATTTVGVVEEQKECEAKGGQFTFQGGVVAHYNPESVQWHTDDGYGTLIGGDFVPTTSPAIDCTVPTHTLWHKELSI